MNLSQLTQLQQTIAQHDMTQSLNVPPSELHSVLPPATTSSVGSKRGRPDDDISGVPKRRAVGAVERAAENDDDDGDAIEAQEQTARIRAAMADPAQMARMLAALQS